MKPLFLSLAFVAALAPFTAAQEAEGPPAPAATKQVAAPAAPQRNFIEDMEAHRVRPARYVRRFEDIVKVDLGPLDLEQDFVLTIDGASVSRDAYLRRAVMFGGLQEVGARLTQIITDREIARLVELGRDPAEFELDAADVDAKYNDYVEVIRMQAGSSLTQNDPSAQPNESDLAAAADEAIKAFEASIDASIGMDAFRNSLVAEVRFEKVFLGLPTTPTPLPEDYPAFGPAAGRPLPDDAPCPPFINATTWQAMSYDSNTLVMRQLLINAGTSGQPIPALFKGQLSSGIRLGLLKFANLTWFYEVDDVDDDVICKLGEESVRVGEIWPFIEPTLNEIDHHLILRELLTLRAMRTTLDSVGAWLDLEATRADFAALEAEYAETLFPLAAIIMFQGYTDIDRYREHFRYRNAYDKWRLESLTEEDLEDHHRTSGRLFFEKGSAVVDIAFADTLSEGGFTSEAFDKASNKLSAAFEGKDTVEAWREITGEFPMPPTRSQTGDERTYQRNQLRLRLTESYMSMFLAGYSLADDIFYRGSPGEVFGPFEMTNRRHGWGAEVNAGAWIARVEGYQGDRPLTPLSGPLLEQARVDFLDLNFLYWAQECLKALLPDVSVPS